MALVRRIRGRVRGGMVPPKPCADTCRRECRFTYVVCEDNALSAFSGGGAGKAEKAKAGEAFEVQPYVGAAEPAQGLAGEVG